jgi:hypothetical protein
MSTVYSIMIPLGVTSTIVACISCTWGWKLTTLPYFVQPKYAYAHSPVATTTYLNPEQVVIVSGPRTEVNEYKRDEKWVPSINESV